MNGREVCEELGLVYQGMVNLGNVSKTIESKRRRLLLSFSHHREVCSIDEPDVQDRFLLWYGETQAVTANVTDTEQLRALVQEELARPHSVTATVTDTVTATLQQALPGLVRTLLSGTASRERNSYRNRYRNGYVDIPRG